MKGRSKTPTKRGSKKDPAKSRPKKASKSVLFMGLPPFLVDKSLDECLADMEDLAESMSGLMLGFHPARGFFLRLSTAILVGLRKIKELEKRRQ